MPDFDPTNPEHRAYVTDRLQDPHAWDLTSVAAALGVAATKEAVGAALLAHSAEIGAVIQGPFERNRVIETWWWERPDNQGDLGYTRPDVLLRCARIWGGRVKVIRLIEHSTATVHAVTSSASMQGPDA